MVKISFESESLIVNWDSPNLQGLVDPRIIAGRLSKYFTPHVLIDGVPEVGFHGFRKKYKVYIQQSTGSKSCWIGTKIIFSGKNASYFYKLLKPRNFDWSLLKFEEHTLSLGRIDLCFSRTNDCSHTNKLFDAFLLDSRSQIQYRTNTKYIKLQDFPDGKMLKVNRRNNSGHYRIYEKVNHLRFELEMRQECFKYCLNSFFSYSFEEFEDELVGIFLAEFQDLCPENSKYSFWLLGRLRRKSSLSKLKNLSLGISKGIVSPYYLNFCKDLESSFKCLQLVSFLQREEIQKDLNFVNSINIAIVEFPITNFLRFIGKNPRNTYHREKYMSFFLNLLELKSLKIKINDNKFVFNSNL